MRAIRILIFLSLVFFSVKSYCDPPTPPADPSSSGGQPVGAPIDGGLGILMAMGVAYGGRKYYQARKEKKKKEKEEAESAAMTELAD